MFSHPFSHLTDTELAGRLRASDAVAFELLFRRHAETLVRYAIGLTRDVRLAEDIVQEVFGSLWIRRTQWDVPDDILSYLIGAVRKNLLHRVRTQLGRQDKTSRFISPGTSPATGAEPVPPDEQIEVLERDSRVWSVILALPEPRRTILIARWLHGLEWAEVAKRVGLSVEATKKQHARTLVALRPVFETLR